MPGENQQDSKYKKYFSYIKDAIYIIGIFIAVAGWLTSESKSKAILETTVKSNTETIEKLETFINNQSVLNGQMIQYMSMAD